MIEDIALSSAIEKALINYGKDTTVCVDSHTAYVETHAAVGAEKELVEEIKEIIETFDEISDIKISCHPIVALSE